MALADWLLPQPFQPGGPVLVPFKPPSGNNIPGPKAVTPPLAGPFDFANAATSFANVAGENKLREVQAQLYGAQAQMQQATLGMLQKYPELLQSMFDAGGGTAGEKGKPAAFGSLAPSGSAGGMAPSPDIDQVTAGDEPEWRAFAQAIAGPESRGKFNVRYTPEGGTTFAGYDKHPGIKERSPQGPSDAAGAWQFLGSTWNGLPEALRPDFQPATQYGGFKYLAERDYAARTGRDLLADLRAGNLDQVEQGLRGTWPTISKALRAYPNLLGNYTQAGTQVAQNAAPAGAAPDLPDTSLAGAGTTFRPSFGGGAPMSLGGGMASMVRPVSMPAAPSPGLANGGGQPGIGAPDSVVSPTGADIKAWAAYHKQNPAATWDQWVSAGAPGGPDGAAARGAPAALPTASVPGALAPPSSTGQINTGLPGMERFNPVRGAIVGSMLEAFKLPNAAKPLTDLFLASPGFKATVEQATAPYKSGVMQNILAAGALPQGSQAQTLAQQGAMNAAGIKPVVVPDRAGQPALRYDPNTGGYQVSPIPGYGQALRDIAIAHAAPVLRDVPDPVTGAPTQRWTLPPMAMGGATAGAAPSGAATDLGMGASLRGMSPLYGKGVEGLMATDKDRLEKTLQPMADKANDMIARGQLIQSLVPRVATGQWAESKQDIGRLLLGMDVSPDWVKRNITDVAAGDVIQKNFLGQSAEAVRAMGAREPGSVISLFSKAYPRLETQANAIQLMQNIFQMQGKREQDEFALAQAHHTASVNGVGQGQPYDPLTKFTANFNAGANKATNYLRAAQAMSDDAAAWSNVNGPDVEAVVSLMPKGTHFLGPDGKPYTRN